LAPIFSRFAPKGPELAFNGRLHKITNVQGVVSIARS
jgi:hypothetical protein